MILEKKEDAAALQALQEMFQGEEFLEDRYLTTLHKIVLEMNHTDLQQYLISCPQSAIDQVDIDGRTALSWASARGDLQTVNLLLASKANPNIASHIGKTALHHAAAAGNVAVIDGLLRNGAMIDTRDKSGLMAIHTVCLAKAPPDCLRRLIEAGTDVEARDVARGGTPLLFTCQSNDAELMKILLENGADIESQTLIAETAIFIATQYNNHQVMRILLSRNANLVRYNNDGLSILHCLAEMGDSTSLKMFTSARIKGLRIDDEDSRGMTPAKLAEGRTEETLEWHAAWADLVASLDQDAPPETPCHRTDHQTEQKPSNQSTLWTLLKAIEDLLSEEVQQIHQYLVRLPRPPSAILRAATVLALAITWLLYSS